MVSNQYLLCAFIILFLSDIAATNQLNDWWSAATKRICAELFFGLFIAIRTLFCHSLTLAVVSLPADPCVQVLRIVLGQGAPTLRVNEWLSMVVMCWLFVRLVYLLVTTCVAHWTAGQKVYKGLGTSLARP